jgi:uncharacterized beta barrel domain-containing protein DUF5777
VSRLPNTCSLDGFADPLTGTNPSEIASAQAVAPMGTIGLTLALCLGLMATSLTAAPLAAATATPADAVAAQQPAGDGAPPPAAPGGATASQPAPTADSAPPATPATPATPAKAADSYLSAATDASRDPVGTRLIDIATPFTSGSRWLELLVTHRFIQPFNQGGNGHNLWGLDSGADVGIGFTYGVLQHLDLSVYRSEFQEDFELAAKYQILQQEAGMPLSLAVRAGEDLLGRDGVEDPHRAFGQLLLARRLAPGWNMFVSPSWAQWTPLLHNAWNTPVGITAPLPGHWLIEAEGIPANRALRDVPGASEFAWHVAFTKPIGWHVFQILIGNSRATTVDQILGGDFAGGFTTHDLRLGFNLIRYFNT